MSLAIETYSLRINRFFVGTHEHKTTLKCPTMQYTYHLKWTLPKVEDLYGRNELTDYKSGGGWKSSFPQSFQACLW